MNNKCNLNSVIDLIYRSEELDNYYIYPDWQLISDHTPLSICIPIFEECFSTKKWVLIKDSEEEEKNFINFIASIYAIDTSDIHNENSLENVIQIIAWSANSLWNCHINITKHSKIWWDASCSNILERYRSIKKLRTGKHLKTQSRKLNAISSIRKFKKLLTEKWAHETL